jgi:hypothetical protein
MMPTSGLLPPDPSNPCAAPSLESLPQFRIRPALKPGRHAALHRLLKHRTAPIASALLQ